MFRPSLRCKMFCFIVVESCGLIDDVVFSKKKSILERILHDRFQLLNLLSNFFTVFSLVSSGNAFLKAFLVPLFLSRDNFSFAIR